MHKFEDMKREAVQKILGAPDLDIALRAYGLIWSFIPEYKFVFGATNGSTPGFAVRLATG